ncbi:zinc/iron permease [Cavenderia fasciculata]|uniref:Zinc/iron permease n=1 Tax=Cavenderia fasciculata TaxID=261658 RepID=F4PVS1_CACFS|nr:zinc/iron permease [Cavenderia fasciculata]EGG20085.1 zinc/iron permease [Cavenderia fasciculata]|eukprot:XP_004367068.1 zinc/iron permease [Cavenderia fasciculata]
MKLKGKGIRIVKGMDIRIRTDSNSDFNAMELLLGSTDGSTTSTSTNNDDEKSELLNAKIGLIVGIFFLTLLSSYIPFILGRAKVKGFITLLSIGTCFAGGVILAGGFNHILPGAEESFTSYFDQVAPENKYREFPFAATIAIFTLLVLVAIDKLIIEGGFQGEKGHNHMNLSSHADNQHHHTNTHAPDLEFGQESSSDEEDSHGATPGNPDGALAPPQHSHGHAHSGKHDELHEKGNGKSHVANTGQAWLFLVALSIHSILDGLGLGAETSKDGFYGLLVAVLAHKMLDGFALGVPIYFANFSTLQTALSLAFCAAMTPLGIGIGMAVTSVYNGSSGHLAEGIILGVTCGSFFYISLIELIPSGLCQPGWLRLKLAMVFLGWACLSVIALWV